MKNTRTSTIVILGIVKRNKKKMIPQQIFKKVPCRKLQLKQNFHYISHSVKRISLLLRTLQSTIDTKKLYSGKIFFTSSRSTTTIRSPHIGHSTTNNATLCCHQRADSCCILPATGGFVSFFARKCVIEYSINNVSNLSPNIP